MRSDHDHRQVRDPVPSRAHRRDGQDHRAVEAPSRRLPGVVHFDVSRSLTDPNALIATEVFTSREALERQNAQREVAAMLDLINAGALTAEYEWTVWETAE